VKVLNGDLFFQRFLLAVRVELANLFSSAIGTTLKVCDNALLALGVKAKGHNQMLAKSNSILSLKHAFSVNQQQGLRLWSWSPTKPLGQLLHSFYYLLTKPFA
jgi:hypothetical protein